MSQTIEGWTCDVNGPTRFAEREAPAGSWHVWLTNGALETEFRPSEPDDDRRNVLVPAGVVAWLLGRPEPARNEASGETTKNT